MITLHVEADTLESLKLKACDELGIELPQATVDKLHAPLPASTAHTPAPASVDKPADAPSSTAPRGPGRPRKVKATEPAAPQEPAAPAPVAQAQEAQRADPALAAAGPAVTADEVKALLQKVAARKNGEGLSDATDIIVKLGYNKVKDIKPEHFAAVKESCEKLLAAA